MKQLSLSVLIGSALLALSTGTAFAQSMSNAPTAINSPSQLSVSHSKTALSAPLVSSKSAVEQYNLGVAYETGKGETQSFAQAVKYFTMSASQGYVKAQYNLGVLYATGKGVTQSTPQAIQWFKLAAAQGDVEAQYNLGVLLTATGDPQEAVQGVAFYQQAAQAHYNKALFNLGVMYANGTVVKQSFATASQYFLKAANQNYAPAQFNLGVMYANGQYFSQSNEQAYIWFDLASSNGYQPAHVYRDEFENDLSLSALQDAQGQVFSFQSLHPTKTTVED